MTRPRIKYRGGKPLPLGVVETAERMAISEATGVKKGELTKLEHKMALAIATLFIQEIEAQWATIAELEKQVEGLKDRILDMRRIRG